jgi:hypothetical protein
MSLSKSAIERKYNVYLDRDKGYDGGTYYWLCFDSIENMEWICNGYTLSEIEEKLKEIK